MTTQEQKRETKADPYGMTTKESIYNNNGEFNGKGNSRFLHCAVRRFGRNDDS
jgi:hypothetical protein